MPRQVTAFSNTTIKRLRSLRDKKARREEGLFLAEGLRIIAEARDSGSAYEAVHNSEPNFTIKSPPSLDHRYIREDVGYGLVPMAEIGRLLGIATPVMDALITLASTALGDDFRSEGLTLAKMGLKGVSAEQFPALLADGF